jgi:uncharacterized protein
LTEISRRKVLRAMGSGMLAGAASPLVAQYCAYQLKVERSHLKLPRWDAKGLKLGFISDFHLNGASQTDRAIESAKVLMAEKPDLIALGGDYLEHSHAPLMENLKRFLSAFQDLTVPVIAIMGNHDYWSRGAAEILSAFKASSVRMLRNEVFEFQGVSVAGIDDHIDRKSDFKFFPVGSVSKSLVALMHEPDVVRFQPLHVSLQVSGHSHGGQVCFPFGKQIHTPGWAKDFIRGYYPRAKVPLYVSRGVGTTGVDYRLFCAPEVTLLELI